jgi:hypothetical protein
MTHTGPGFSKILLNSLRIRLDLLALCLGRAHLHV